MIELKKYQCEHCRTVFDRSDHARRCESNHIERYDIQLVRAIHKRCTSIIAPEGQWPEAIVVGKTGFRDVFMRYKYEGEETTTGPFLADSYYNPDNK